MTTLPEREDSSQPAVAGPELRPTLTAEGARYATRGVRLDYVPEAPPAAGGFVGLCPGLRWLRMPLPMALNHINLWLLEAEDGWLLIDTGLATDATRELWTGHARQLLAGKPLRLIVLTHFHPDHAGLARWLQDLHGVPVWMSHDTQAVLAEWSARDPAAATADARAYYASHGVTDAAELDLMATRGVGRPEMRPALPEVARFLGEGDRFEWAGTPWRVLATNGHAIGHLCFETPSAARPERPALLIAGDQVLPTISPNVSLHPRPPDPDPLRSYLESLERLAGLSGHLVLPSHGIPFRGVAARAQALAAHHAAQLAKLREACAASSRSAHELLAVMYRRALGPFDKTLGIGETVAHLEHLVAQGRLERRVDAGANIRYRAESSAMSVPLPDRAY